MSETNSRGSEILAERFEVFKRYNISEKEIDIMSGLLMPQFNKRIEQQTAEQCISEAVSADRLADVLKAYGELFNIHARFYSYMISLFDNKDDVIEYMENTIFRNRNADNSSIRYSLEYIENITTPATAYIYPNDKITNSLQKISIDGEEQPLKDLKDAQTYITFSFDEAAELTDLDRFNVNFTEFDQQIQEAVVSLMKAGNRIITEHMIYKTLTQTTAENMPNKWREDIQTSMKKFNSVFIEARFDELIPYYPEFEQIKKMVKGTRLFQFEKTYIQTKNGNEILAYEMLKEPILYTIANAKNQVGTIPIKALESKKLKNTKENTILKNYLLKRIDQMKKGGGKISNAILYETLYEKMNRRTKKEKITARDNADMLLLQFKADKVIKDYEIEKVRNQAIKIKIIF